MIADILRFLRDRLNKAVPRDSSGGPVEDLFAYVGTGKDDAVSFKSDSVPMLLIRIGKDVRSPSATKKWIPTVSQAL